MLKLYTARNSICTQKVFITLAEKNAPYETQYINLFANEQYQSWYLKINPKGVVPTLDHDGSIVIESTLIAEYLDEVLPGVRLTPPDSLARARMRLWSKAVDEGLFEATRELSFSAMFRQKMRDMTEEQREGRFRNVGDPVKRARFMSTYEQGVDSPYVYEGIGKFEIAFRTMERDLASGLDWLVGDQMTLADVNMMPFVARLEYLNLLDLWLADRPLTQAWWSRAKTRPSFAAAIVQKLDTDEVAAMHGFGSKIRDRVRERRDEFTRQPRSGP